MRPLLNHGSKPRFSRIAIYVLAFIATTGAAMAAALSAFLTPKPTATAGCKRRSSEPAEGILKDAGLTFVLGGLPIIFGFGVVWYMHHTFERLK